MTAAQLYDARMLIPGAFELNAPPHRGPRPGSPVPAASLRDARPGPAMAETPYVVAAPFRPTSLPGRAAAILGDLALIIGIIFGVALVPGLAVMGVQAAVTFIVDTFSRP
jgi:hypothetical protein